MKKFLEFLDKRIEGFGGAQYKNFGLFGVINYPLGYFLLRFLGGDENLVARLFAAILCIPLIMPERWSFPLKKYLNAYWLCTLLYCLPTFTTYSLLQNHFSNEWMMNFSIGLFILFLLVDYILLLILYGAGIILALVVFKITGQDIIFQQDFPVTFLYIYVAMVAVGCIFAHNKEKQDKDRIKTIKSLAGAIAHEMRTPLAAINLMAKNLKMRIPTLLAGYTPLQNSEGEDLLNKKDVAFLQEAPDDIKKINQQSFVFIDMLLMNLKEDFPSSNPTICSIDACVEEALLHYPFERDQKQWVSYKKEGDFQFKGNNLFIQHIFFNLLKNAIYYVRAANKGEITISTHAGENVNKIYFKDTGAGIPPHILPHIFDKFYTKTKYGTGIGLSFCKIVMEKLGGNIVCHSKEGEYTEFVLTLPVIR